MPKSFPAGVVLAALALSLPFASPFSTCVSVSVPRRGCAAPGGSGGGGGGMLRCVGERGRLRACYRGVGASRDRHGCAGTVCMSSEGAWTGFEQQAGFPARFPESVEDAMEQAGDAVLAALDDGIARVRIQLRMPEFNPMEMPMEQGCVVSFLNSLGGNLVDRGLRANFVFNTIKDASEANRLVSPELSDRISINVLGLARFAEEDDICVLVCPSNEGKDLRRIEDVERLIYAGPPKSMVSRAERKKFLSRPIVLVNPNLEAIHQQSTEKNKVAPMFMSDFTTAYFFDPRAMVSQTSEAAILKQYPSQWQLWMRSAREKSSKYRLIWERTTVPSLGDLTPLFNDLDDRSNGRRSM